MHLSTQGRKQCRSNAHNHCIFVALAHYFISAVYLYPSSPLSCAKPRGCCERSRVRGLTKPMIDRYEGKSASMYTEAAR